MKKRCSRCEENKNKQLPQLEHRGVGEFKSLVSSQQMRGKAPAEGHIRPGVTGVVPRGRKGDTAAEGYPRLASNPWSSCLLSMDYRGGRPQPFPVLDS